MCAHTDNTNENSSRLPACDREAQELLLLQMKPRAHSRAGDITLVALFLSAIFVFSALFWILPDKTVSDRENRQLQQMPKVTASRILSGKFAADIADYMADQFPARDFFISLKAISETALGKGGNNGVLFGTGGTLVPREDLPDTDNLEKSLSAIGTFSAYLEEQNIPVMTVVAGRTADVLTHTLPDFYGSSYSDRLFDVLTEEAARAGVDLLPLRAPLRDRAQAGEYVYYRTDHHWTTLGAYYGYREIAAALGVTPYPLSDFTAETVSDAFYGTTWSTAGAFFVAPDTMEFFRFAGDEGYTTEIHDPDKARAFSGFYDREFLAKKDKYSAFLGGNSALVTVTADASAGERETLLLFKDSFAHAAVPFLARHYDLVIVDLRYYKENAANLLAKYDIDQVLFFYNIDSLTASESPGEFIFGLKIPSKSENEGDYGEENTGIQ